MMRIDNSKTFPIINFKAAKPIVERYNFGKKQEGDSFQLSVGYVNDTHGQVNNQLRILSGLEGDIRFSGGDDQIGSEKNHEVNAAVVQFLDAANIFARAMGNHEMDTTTTDFCELNDGHKTKLLTINFREKANRPDKTIFNNIKKDIAVAEVKGEKIGIIGASPNDIFERVNDPAYIKDCEVDNYYQTFQKIKDSVEKFKEQGINKIFLLSHLGHNKNKDIASKINGIDVIIGGHTHELLKGIKEGENLIYSPDGEPVVITQAGKDGHHFGLLNLEFDKDGVITKAQNNIKRTCNYPKSYIYEYLLNRLLGPAEIVGEISSVIPPPENIYITENPHSNFVCDVLRETTGAEIGLWNSSGIRSSFHVGKVNTRDVHEVSPFADETVVVPLTEKELVDGFNMAIKKSLSRSDNKPGFYAVSGLNYTVSKSKKALAGMNFIDKNGNEIPIDVENPNPNRVYRVVAPKFVMLGGDGITVFNKLKDAYEIYHYDKDKFVCDYMKKQDKPIEINQVGRMKYVD